MSFYLRRYNAKQRLAHNSSPSANVWVSFEDCLFFILHVRFRTSHIITLWQERSVLGSVRAEPQTVI